jgi:hypothetical protein
MPVAGQQGQQGQRLPEPVAVVPVVLEVLVAVKLLVAILIQATELRAAMGIQAPQVEVVDPILATMAATYSIADRTHGAEITVGLAPLVFLVLRHS